MHPGAVMINTSRGKVVQEAALLNGCIRGAALDVFADEPIPASSPLLRMENVIITPHVAAASTHIAERHLQTLVENIRLFVAGKEPVNTFLAQINLEQPQFDAAIKAANLKPE